jgi:hypothetical protein
MVIMDGLHIALELCKIRQNLLLARKWLTSHEKLIVTLPAFQLVQQV